MRDEKVIAVNHLHGKEFKPGFSLKRAPGTVSVVAPVYNEEENVPFLGERLLEVMRTLGRPFEIVLVNDGSRDNSWMELVKLAQENPEIKVIDLKRNSGQTAALMCALDHSTGAIIVPIDADLQNDPKDIPKLLAELDKGFDVVSGWRHQRKDAPIKRNFVSRIANGLISRISGVGLHDYGCSLKAYRWEVLDGVRLYGEMHRFVPIYASWMGARITEIPVEHHPRVHGVSKYGLERVVKVVLDLLVVKFLDRHLVKPIYIFGGIGASSMVLSFVALLWAIYLKLFEGTSLIQTPLPLLSVMFFVTGVMCILMGLVSEMLSRTYFESQAKRSYAVRSVINVE
ncbi:glycosyltransferase family 2 protein [Microvirga sp. BT689]|uniref:glycosyltransferase family 2 protein n=1 Tax=Microvirga arvi TaxID=2778731 RepID=UPI00194DF0F7|nr:glycosyltransferase family 2 protein [Microvirga arvi]MBM6583770.1 glycosyltransferase family 2 protein [Microvirga arvi]